MARHRIEQTTEVDSVRQLTAADLDGKKFSKAELGDEVKDGRGKKLGVLIRCREWEGISYAVPITSVVPRADQPRHDWGGDSGLSGSVEEIGQQEALRVVPFLEEKTRCIKFLIISGERRYRGLVEAGAKTANILIEWNPSMPTLFERAYTANRARKDLNPIEDAEALKRIMEERRSKTGEDIDRVVAQFAKEVGESKPQHLRDSLDLLNLAPEIQEWVRKGIMAVTPALFIVRKFRDDELKQKTVADLLRQKAKTKSVTVQDVNRALTRVSMQGGARGMVSAHAVTGARVVGNFADAITSMSRAGEALVAAKGRDDVVQALGSYSQAPRILKQLDALEGTIEEVRAAIAESVDSADVPLIRRAEVCGALAKILNTYPDDGLAYADLISLQRKVNALDERCPESGTPRAVLDDFKGKLALAISRTDKKHPNRKFVGLKRSLRSLLQ